MLKRLLLVFASFALFITRAEGSSYSMAWASSTTNASVSEKSLICGTNEIFSNCSNGGCGSKTCDQLGYRIGCVKMDQNYCREGCICKEGYLKDANGACIPKTKCPSCGGDPFALSGCGLNCGKLCSNYNKGLVPCPRICLPNACDCKEGYVKDENLKKCVRPEDCTSSCGVNEVYDTCANGGCRRWKCSQLELCIDPLNCEGGCVCQDKYSRADNGTCIPEHQCAPTCSLNEVYDTCANGGCRRWNCSESILCIDRKICEPGCSCQDGYSRGKNGVCIPENQCPGLCNKPREYYDDCPLTCTPQTCESIGKKYSCPAQLIPPNCKGKCMCEKGYYRNSLGDCISEENCKKCSGLNEYYSCGGACDNVCATLNKQNQTKCPIINIVCNSMCYCKEGYARDENKICIPIDQCPEPQCSNDEKYEKCPSNLCLPQKCSQLGFPLNCSSSSENVCPGEPGCICGNDKVRDDNGKCIPAEQCPSCGGDKNAVTGCGNNCGRRCSDFKEKNKVCALFCILNGCVCRHGFVYDDNLKKCVQPADCTPTCRVNEVYDTCANGGCRRWNCSKSILCIDHVKCKAGCSCQKGFSRARNGTCIKEDQCLEPQCGPNERLKGCPDTVCSPQTCSQLGYPIDCAASTSLATYNSSCIIRPACVCDDGYVKDDDGSCIPPEKCPSCGGDPNAIRGCGVNCRRLCSNYDKRPVPCRKICKVNSCDCNIGFVLDQNIGKCVRPENCSPVCGKNELYSECINGGCQRNKCSQLGKSVICVKMNPEKCIKGCLCKDKYLRTDNGTCIPEDQCREICTGLHEYFSCGGECDNKCTTLQTQNQSHCPLINKRCNFKCYCQKGYTGNAKNICIPINQSQVNVCGPNENYEEKPSLVCEPRQCSELGFPLNCSSVEDPNYKYEPACICKEGYLRDNRRVCVTKSQCPS